MTMTKTPFSDIELQFKAGYFCGSEQYTDEVLAFFKTKWEQREQELREAIENMKHKSTKDQFGYDPIDNQIFSREKEHNETIDKVLALLDSNQE